MGELNLKNLIVDKAEVEVEHPSLEGFYVTIAFVSKDRTRKMAERATTIKYSKRTRQPEEEIDSELFMKLYTKEMIKGWRGLKLGYLKELLPVNLGDRDEEEEIEYSEENALDLMKSSVDFDNWISSISNDVGNFNKSK